MHMKKDTQFTTRTGPKCILFDLTYACTRTLTHTLKAIYKIDDVLNSISSPFPYNYISFVSGMVNFVVFFLHYVWCSFFFELICFVF